MSSVTDKTVTLNYANGLEVEAQILRCPSSTCLERRWRCVGSEAELFGTLSGWKEGVQYRLFDELTSPGTPQEWFLVDKLHNYTRGLQDKQVKGVGTELMLVAIEESLQSPAMQGRLGLSAITGSYGFYRKLGLSVVPRDDRIFPDLSFYLRLKNHQSTPQDLVRYEHLRTVVAESRGVDPNTLSLEGVCSSSLNSMIDEEIASGECQTGEIDAAFMFLPFEQIERYRSMFNPGGF